MKTINSGILVISGLIVLCLAGCGYTILRDMDEEERQAEWAAIDSLTTGPDLIISDVEYEYIPPEPRRNALDRSISPARGMFYITIKNIGTADIPPQYFISCEKLNPQPYDINKFYSLEPKSGLPAIGRGRQELLKIYFMYPPDSSTYRFTIITNSIVQNRAYDVLRRSVNTTSVRLRTRELRYDNNNIEVSIPGYLDIQRREDQRIRPAQ
jgi:hypothetical protein